MIIIGSDHGGIELKKRIIDYFLKSHIQYSDVTNYKNQEGDDYPDIATIICSKVLENDTNLGVAICGTGVGISIACNKIKKIRAALCYDTFTSEMSRKHNDANVLCLGARTSIAQNQKEIESIISTFINSFYEGGRHEMRLEKIEKIETNTIEGDK
ncbi:MAG: ribose 5-phosphate isomerase B [Clostridia bacterium]